MLKANNPSICGMRVRCGEFHCLIAQCIMCSLRLRTCIRRHALCSGIHFRIFSMPLWDFNSLWLTLSMGFCSQNKKNSNENNYIRHRCVCVCCGDGCVRWAYTTYPIWWQRKQSRMAGLYLLILQCAPHTLLHSIIRSQPPSSSFMLKRSIGCLLRQQQTTTTKMWINKNKTSMGCSREHFHAVCMSFMIVPFGEKLLYVSRVEVEALYNPCTALHTCIPQLCGNGRHTQTCTMHHIRICFRRTADGLAVSTYEATR